MKKHILATISAAVLLCLTHTASAVPAKPGNIVRTQPDGSTIMVNVHGDEWFHYVTDLDGNLLEENPSGFMVRSNTTIEALSTEVARARAAREEMTILREAAILKAKASGSPKIPVVLVQFSDRSFTIKDPKTAFTNLLTQAGYSANGGTGSVLDYYKDQSRGAYSPQFVVLDVVTLSGRMSSYGSTDEYAAKALYEACQKLDSTVDFSQFDNDGDGVIDMTLLYYAGYNEAEGGPEATIWPHQFYVPSVVTNAQSFDGVKLNRYFCTSELKGASGADMCGIGTTCHEFAHSLGLPDFYDTNYNEYGDGEAGATYEYDVMCSGSYNNDGCTPPWMNAEELVMLGWMNSISELPGSGSVTIPSIAASTPVAYKSGTSATGEYFLYESRPGTAWDAPLGGGLLVYHVDKSPSHTISWRRTAYSTTSQTAAALWSNWETYNAINCNGSHPCFYIVPSGNQESLNYAGTAFTYPGPSSIKSFVPKDWSGQETGIALSSISFNALSGAVTLNVVDSNAPGLSGVVYNSTGAPIVGAELTLRAASAAFVPNTAGNLDELYRVGSFLKADGAVLQTVTTDLDGSYTFDIASAGKYIISVTKTGYVGKTATVEVNGLTTKNFYLTREGETAPSEIYIYPDNADWGSYGSSSYSSWSMMCANRYPASMLGTLVGKQIKSISFVIDGTSTTTGTVHALLDFGNKRKLTVPVSKPVAGDWTTVDISDEEILIEEDTDIFAGYAINNWRYSYPFTATDPASPDLIGYMADYSLTSTAWSPWSFVFKIKLSIGDYTAPETGYNFISDPGNGSYRVGSVFKLELTETSSDRRPDTNGVAWFYDDEPVSDNVVLKTAGAHTVSAKFTTVSGDSKVIDLEINVY